MRRIALLLVVGTGCLADPNPDLEGPRIIGSSFGESGLVELEVAPTFWLEFSEAVDPSTVVTGYLALVAWEEVGVCDLTPVCAKGRCARGRCWDDPLSSAELRALDDGEYPGGVEMERVLEEGARLELRPAATLRPRSLYSLVLGEGVRDLSGAGLLDAWGRPRHWRRELVTASEGSSGPEPRLSSPRSGQESVPTNLAWIETEFVQPVVVDPDATLQLTDDRGLTIDLSNPVTCPGFVPGFCLRWKAPPLLPDRRYEPTGGRLLDRHGRSVVPPTDAPWFRTASGPDQDPPRIDDYSLTLRGGCLVAEAWAAEPVTATLRVGTQVAEVEGSGTLVAALRVASTDVASASLELRDLAGNVATAQLELPRLVLAPTLTLTEVLANPAGAEPDQEFVELANIGDEPISLDGLHLVDQDWTEVLDELEHGADPPGDRLPAAELPGRAIGIVVSDRYDAQAGDDPGPPVDGRLLRVDASLGNSGLKNAGEPLTLYIADPPMLVASYGNFIDTSASDHSGRSVSLVRPEACDVEASWQSHPLGRSTPGRLP